MSDLSTKLTYLNETKKQIKEALGTNDDTFRNYTKEIEFENKYLKQLQNNQLAVNDAGNELILHNSANVLVNVIDENNNVLSGITSQETRVGYNLWNGKGFKSESKNGITLTVNDDGSFDLIGTATADTTFDYMEPLANSKIKNETKYTMYPDNKEPYHFQCYLAFWNNKTWVNTPIQQYWGDKQSKTGTTNFSNANKVSIGIIVSKDEKINYKNCKIILVEGTDTTKPYEEYGALPTPQTSSDIHCVTGTQKIEITNKNLYNQGIDEKAAILAGISSQCTKSSINLNGTTSTHGDVIRKTTNFINSRLIRKLGKFKKGTYKQIITKSGSISVDKNTSDSAFYILGQNSKGVITQYTTNAMIYNTWYNNQVIRSFTLNEEQELYAQMFANSAGITFDNFKLEILVVDENETDTSFIEHSDNFKIIHLNDVELYGNDIARDTLKVDVTVQNNGYKKVNKLYKYKNYEKVNLKNLNNWYANASRDGKFRYANTKLKGLDKIPINNNDIANITCTHYQTLSASSTWNNTQGISIGTDDIIYICDTRFSDTSNLSGFLEYIQANDIYLVFQILTPKLEEITNTTLIADVENFINFTEAYLGSTHIDSNAYLNVNYSIDINKLTDIQIIEDIATASVEEII